MDIFEDRIPAEGKAGIKRIIKVNPITNIATGEPDTYVRIENADNASIQGTELKAENLNKLQQKAPFDNKLYGLKNEKLEEFSGINTNNTEINLQQNGDMHGATSLSLQNRTGANGAIFKNFGQDLVDFGFRPSIKAGGNLRFEGRTDFVNARNTEGEFQIMNPAGIYTARFGVGANAVAELSKPLQLIPVTNLNPQNGDIWTDGTNLYFRTDNINIVLNGGGGGVMPSNFVTTDTPQTITAVKTFTVSPIVPDITIS